MRLTKASPLADLKDTAGLQAWQTDQQLTKSDMSPFQRAYFLNELAAAYLQLSINIIDANDLKKMMAEMKPTVVQPTKTPVKRTRKPPPTKAAPPRPKPRTGRKKPDA